jgi:arsenical pump membrane protein
MQEAVTVTALAITLSLALRRPVMLSRLRIGPGIAVCVGVAIVTATGGLSGPDVIGAVDVLWRPLVALVSIMVMVGVAARVGVFQRLAELILPHAAAGAHRLFGLVFALGLVTAAVFNNDAAILVLTPVVVTLIRRIYPDSPALLLPFAFAVFMAAGVAPFLTSNPMNTVVALSAGIDFHSYALRMVPVALAAALVTFLILRRVFAADLAAAPAAAAIAAVVSARTPWSGVQRQSLTLVLVVLAAYPVASLAGLPVFVIAAGGAAVALGLAWWHGAGRPPTVIRGAVAWEIVVFLFGMYILARALQNIGVVDQLRGLYEAGGMPVVGLTSAVGSALINNHSMALTNLLAIQGLGGEQQAYLAALIGGDLGPRLLPIGSLAGLLWLTLLGRLGVTVPLRTFVTVGAVVTVPSLIVSLAVLALF